MKSVVGRRREIPGPLLRAVLDHARDLGRQVAGDDLFLLAIAGLDSDPPARLALEAESVTAERLLGEVRTEADEAAGQPGGLTFSPAYYTVHGLAQGMAVSLGDGRITPEHVLLALLWEPGSASSQLLWRLGVDRSRLVGRLSDLGVPVPASPLPAQEEIDLGEPVWFDRDQVRPVLDHLRSRLAPEVHWGFNYDEDRAWAQAEASVDLDRLVAEALPSGFAVRRIDHVQLAMPAGGEEQAVAFYAELLGLAPVPKPEPLRQRGGCWFENKGVRVHLGVETDFRPNRKAHPAFLVRGLDLLRDALAAAGVVVREGDPVDDASQVYIDDPFGNRLELLEEPG